MKTSKSFTEAEIAELPKLPDSWRRTKLGEIAYINSGNTPKSLKEAENKGQFPFYKVSDMNSEGNETWMKTSNLYLTNDEKVLFKVKEEQKGTIIFPKRGGAILTNKKRRLSCNASYDLNIMGVKEVSKHILNGFLWYWFSKLDLRKLYDGSNVPQINNKDIEPLFFPLPPLPEQRAIVSKIELLFSELDNGISNLKLAQEQLKVYRQAVLKKAFEGELTQIQNSITFVQLGKIVEIVSGNTPKGLDTVSNSGTIQFYKVSDMNLEGNEVEMKYSNIMLTENELDNLNIKLWPEGTVIFPKRGGAILTNKKRILSKPSAFDLNIMGVLPNDKVDSKYLFYWILKLDLAKIYDGSNVPQINKKNIDPLEFPICLIEEQYAIVQEIETRLSVCDKIEQDIKENLEKAEALRQSILKKAFEGKLLNERELAEVRGAEDWEPAEVLLERIKAERAKK
ncbi:restriction endonuclease [Methanosarcina sp. MSH10X1]|uniref:restriction endonuclease subunit S n=1 Tax=Methanosarcina sp. MSH10X1 TaxID=2507075 RepID=UPI000FFC2FA4|nr:restriction endonuclease subunit S [Methanosarcina sp. MSH10X1]RXA17826.1 restriction endonuclease [Methanosarcina sp. MSH10X1]